ncbi:hypothetical protein F5Y14DRAFT_430443 [Nemania sp. NC0429]|nr:hypothetical protein F5Y14DRAFT_430443 [Nemania sp. NC0429]
MRAARSATANAGLGAKLTSLFAADLSLEGSNLNELETSQLIRYHLLQQRSCFANLCAEEGARKWIEKAMLDYPLFLIVGLITVQDANTQAERQRDGQGSIFVEAPVGEAIGVPGPEGVANARISLHGGGSSGRSISFIAPGERVFGVWYRVQDA